MMMPQQSNFTAPANKDADQAYAIKAAEFRGLPNTPEGMAKLRQETQGPFGSLALIEINNRTRADLMDAVRKQNANLQEGTMLQQALQQQAQAQMMNRLADDERMGLNNIIAQAEQGGLEFGQPTDQQAPQGVMPTMAGGGVVAFRNGGETPKFAAGAIIGAIGRAAPYAGRAVGRGIKTLRERMVTPGQAALMATPFGFLGGGDDEEAVGTTDSVRSDSDYPDETLRGTAKDVAAGRKAPDRFDSLGIAAQEARAKGAPSADRTGISGLIKPPEAETDVRKILAREDELLAEMGLGEYGAKVRESIEGRRGKAEELYGRAMSSEPFLAAAEAAGGGAERRRMGGLEAVASALSAAGKSAAGIRREERAAIDKITEGEEKLLLAQDLYQRGRVSDAQKMGREAQQQIFNNNVKLQTLQMQEREIAGKEKYYDALIQSAGAKGAGTFKGGDVARLSQEIQNIMGLIQVEKDPAQKQLLMQQLKALRAAQARTMLGGIQITDTPD